MGNPSIREVKGWKTIWRAPVLHRIRLLSWLAIQDKLMMNASRFPRNMTEDPRCFVCGDVEKNSNHILRKCLVARIVWRNSSLVILN